MVTIREQDFKACLALELVGFVTRTLRSGNRAAGVLDAALLKQKFCGWRVEPACLRSDCHDKNFPGELAMKNPSIAFVLLASSLVGCGELPDAADDEGVTEETSALGTLPAYPTKFRLRNYQTGLCLGVSAGTPTWGTPLITWYCDGSANQNWSQTTKYSATDKGLVVAIKNYVAADRCMHTNSPAADGTPAVIFTCDGILGWKPIYSGTNLEGHECYRFMKEQSATEVLGVAGGNQNMGTKTILWTDFNSIYGHPDQFWCIY